MAERGGGSAIAVLTGDVVRSSRLDHDRLRRLLRRVEAGLAAFAGVHPVRPCGGVDVFRGDSWQLAVEDARYALRLAVYLRAIAIQSAVADMRIAIGIGGYDELVPVEISRSTGEAFTLSGQALDGLGKRRLALAAADPASGLLDAVTVLVDALIGTWSSKQAGAVRLMIEHPGLSDEQIVKATRTAGDRRNFAKLRARAHGDSLMDALDICEASRSRRGALP